LFQAKQGKRFVGLCGCTNFCACLLVDEICHITLVLQSTAAACSLSPHEGRKPVSAADFRHAVGLVRVILRYLESTVQARMANRELKNALCKLADAETEATYFRKKLCHRLPCLPNPTPRHDLESRAQMHVEAVLDYLHQHCHCPMSLGEVASAMKINAAYLSTLFTRTTGMPFHQFLQEVRLSRAKELLRDPRNRVSEVALAVGYASPDAFRRAFKAREGHSPDAWGCSNEFSDLPSNPKKCLLFQNLTCFQKTRHF
jgi:AraC-like DNA-binding protein